MQIPIQKSEEVQEVATGITGVTARKSGNIVTLVIAPSAITVSSASWHPLGTLPQELRPSMNLRFTGFDNSAETYAASPVLPFTISASGAVSVYFFRDKLTMTPHASVTYITN